MSITHQNIYEGLSQSGHVGHIDLSAVADFLNVKLIDWELPKQITSKVCVRHGCVYLAMNQLFSHHQPLYRFMAAHAIGHIALGHAMENHEINDEMSNYRIPQAPEAEQAATRWGIELLAPQQLAKLIIKRDKNPHQALKDHFNIPSQVASYLIAQENITKS